MKKVSVLILLVLIFSLPTLAEVDNNATENELDVIVNPASAWSEDFNVTALGLISVSSSPNNVSYVYHLTIHNGTNYQILSRYNVTGDLFFNFIWEGIFRSYIWNPGGEVLEVDLELHSDALNDAEGFGYYFDFDENRCLQTTVPASSYQILSISHLERGEYKLKISSFEDNAKLSFYLSDLNPSVEPDWKDSAISVTWTEFLERNIQIEQGYDWIVLSSNDGYSHTVTLVMVYLGGPGLRTQDIVIAIAFVAALLLFFTTQVTNRKKRKNRRSYYSSKPSRKDLQKQLHLVSQVDIRHEGGRYVYLPPDVINPELLDEGIVEDEQQGK